MHVTNSQMFMISIKLRHLMDEIRSNSATLPKKHSQIHVFLFQPDFGMSSFLKVDIKLVIEDGRNSNQKKTFNLRDVDDDIESLYQTRAKDWFPFSLTMKVPNQDAHQTVQVANFKKHFYFIRSHE